MDRLLDCSIDLSPMGKSYLPRSMEGREKKRKYGKEGEERMNKKTRRQIHRFARAAKAFAKEANRFAKAVRMATANMTQLPVLVKAIKEKYGLTDR